MRALCTMAASLLIGCGVHFDHLAYAPACDSDCVVSGSFEPNRIAVLAGTADSARVTAVDTDGDPMVCDIGLVPDDERVMKVEPSWGGDTVFIGLTSGTTSLGVSCDGDIVGHVEGVVNDDPSR